MTFNSLLYTVYKRYSPHAGMHTAPTNTRDAVLRRKFPSRHQKASR